MQTKQNKRRRRRKRLLCVLLMSSQSTPPYYRVRFAEGYIFRMHAESVTELKQLIVSSMCCCYHPLFALTPLTPLTT